MEKMKTFVLGMELKPQEGKRAVYDFSKSGMLDVNLLPMIADYL